MGQDSESCHLLPWPSGDGASFTWRTTQVRVLPGVLRSGLESGFQHGLISRPTPVQIRPPQLPGLEVLRRHTTLVWWRSGFDSQRDLCSSYGDGCAGGPRVPCKHLVMGSSPIVSTESCPAKRGWTCDSLGLWSNGKTPAWRAGNAGSTPAGSTDLRKAAG